MFRILPGIHSLEQHLAHLVDQPESYRPQRCPHCGKAGVWSHGHYERKAPPSEGVAFALDAIFIPRFLCPHCQRTCSRLPACIAPLRRYLWKVQQAVLARLLAGESIRQVSRTLLPSRRTIARWWQWLRSQFDVHALHLSSRFAELGRAVDWKAFWRGCFERMRLCEAMSWLDRAGVVVP
jgi:transposase-like protein